MVRGAAVDICTTLVYTDTLGNCLEAFYDQGGHFGTHICSTGVPVLEADTDAQVARICF